MPINLTVPPYNDDFKVSDGYYKVLFRPGYSIQTRELNNLQSILQNQIESIGKNRFKQGEQVIPGEVSFNNKLDFVKLSSVSEVAVNINGNIEYKKYDIKQLAELKATLKGLTSGVTATVLSYSYSNENESDVLYVKYTNSGNANNESTFRQGETLEVLDIVNSPTLVVGTDGSVLPTTIAVKDYDTGVITEKPSLAMGYASAVKVESGVYFVNGFFVNNPEELIVVDKYYDKPSVKVGFEISENIITPELENDLYDNSRGSTNFSAPGAHRLKIGLTLVAYDYDYYPDSAYIQLVTIKNGEIQQLIKSTDYNIIEETLARRTYDESGNYVVNNFSLDLREYYQKNNNKGFYPLNTSTNLVNGKSIEEASSLMRLGVSSGKAYIKGYEVIKKDTTYLDATKARDTLTTDNNEIKTTSLAYFNVTNVFGSVPLNVFGQDLTAYPNVYLNSVFNDGTIGLNNTEKATDPKQTVNRRSLSFGLDDGIMTICLKNPSSFGSRTFPSPTEFNTSFQKLWYVVSLGVSSVNTVARSVNVLSYSIVTRKDIPYSGNTPPSYLELTVYGDKQDLQNFLVEYDEYDPTKRRLLFATQSDAQGYYFQAVGVTDITPYSQIIDYGSITTPTIGLCKPKDFTLIEKGSGFNTDVDIVLSRGRLSEGTSTYNSIFRLSYFNPTFFTQITLDSVIQTSTFLPGKYITGSTSGSYGVIEGSYTSKYTNGTILFVKTLSGKFLSGETISDEAGNSKRIAREGTISHFIVNDRGAGYPLSSQIKINGVSYNNSAVEIGLYATQIYKINIKDKNLVSQVYSSVPAISFDTGSTNPTQSAVVTPILYRNTVLDYSSENVKSLNCTFGSGNSHTFTCDVESFKSDYVTSKILTDFTFSGYKGTNYIECNGFSGDPSSDLIPGDLVQFTDAASNVVRTLVRRVDKAEGLIKSKIYFDSILQNDVVNTSVVRVRPIIQNASKSSLLIPTGYRYLSSVVKDPEDSAIKYYFRRDFVVTASTSGGNITFAAQLPYGTQRFAQFSEKNFILTVLDKKSATTVDTGDIVYLKSSQVTITNSNNAAGGVTAGSVTISLPSSFFGTSTDFPLLKLTATIEVLKTKPRLKTIYRNKRILVTSPGDKVVPFRGIDIDSNKSDVLSYSDAISVAHIYEGTVQSPPVISSTNELITGTDVTEKFSFDNGQRDTFYDVSRLVLKPGYIPPTGQLIIVFDYFEHSQGDFCTIDSYIHESGVGLDEIPTFNSAIYGNISLRDVIDFRPKVDSSAFISGYQDTAILSVSDYNNFTGSGGVSSSTPATETEISYTISFSTKQFLDRIDGVFLNKKGEFVIKEGNSSLNPTKPEDIEDSIPLYYLYVPAYTTGVNDVRIIPVDNKRYTMRDIGKLEKRIERLEKYTLLSMLEQQALNMQVKNEIGIDRFKSGFLVDNFENHGIGNLASLDYKCSIDTQQSVLRPRSIESCFKLEEINVREEQRILDHYKKSHDIVTLPFSSVELIKNPFATEKININPFVVIQYVGDARLSPNVDRWFSDREKPLILDNDSKVFSVFYAKDDAREGFASIYNNFIVDWIGTNRVFFNTTPLNEVSSISALDTSTIATIASSSNISPQNNQIGQGVSTKTVGSVVVSSSLQLFCRSTPVYFNLTRMKPKTKLYVFMDNKSIDRWVVQDYKYTGIAGNSLSSFNSGITTDSNGNASGMILIPDGLPPQSGSSWTGDTKTVFYDETGLSLSFVTGEKTIKFSSDDMGSTDSTVDSFTEVKYYASGTYPEQPSTIISTSPAIFKSTEGIQFVENTKAETSPNPITQTFTIQKFTGGVFCTGVDLFFAKKSSNIPVKVYLTNVDSGKPGKYIVPGSECVLNPDTQLKIYTNGTLYISQGEYCTGISSGASGPVKEIYDKNNSLVNPSITGVYTLTNDQVYTLVLSNHNGKNYIATEELVFPSLTSYNAAQNTSLRVFIPKDSGKIKSLRINNTGGGYETATITIQSPQLLGGVQATATCSVSSGSIFDTNLIVGGSGYTDVPSVIIKGTGSSASGASIEAILDIDTPSVRMGVATDPGTTDVQDSVTPTRFNFEYPVYLQNNTEYGLAIESDSTDYIIWGSKLGGTEVASNSVVTATPLLGSVFKSQNVDTWSEDIFEDIKFTLYRAEFEIKSPGYLYLRNKELGYELLDENPFETDSLSDSNATSSLFRNNNKIVKVSQRNHGFEDSGNSYVNYKSVPNFAGYSSELFTSTLFQVDNASTENYTINPGINASSNSISGGSKVLSTYNRKYEKLFAQLSYLNFSETTINAEVFTTNIIPNDSKNSNYISYSTHDFEKTFLNEEHFFNNQKVICSRINELKNIATDDKDSLKYKIILSSDVSYLSPVVDLRTANVVAVTNQVEKSYGKENKYGRRNQVIQFYSVYKFGIQGANSNTINVGDASSPKLVKGALSQAQAVVVKLDTVNSELYVKMLTDTLLIPGETLQFASQPSLTTVSITSAGLSEVAFSFNANSVVTAIDRSNTTQTYDNVISGKVVSWDSQKKLLTVANNKNPINNNYTSSATTGSDYARIPKTSSSTQSTDIFRVYDLLSYENQPSDTKSFLEIKSIDYSDGILYVPEIKKNSSSVAKYVTKEITLENIATCIDVRLTANLYEIDDVIVLYKYKPSNSQYNFDDLSWNYFNGDGKPDVEVTPSPDNTIAGYIQKQSSYKEYSYSVSSLPEFVSYAVKIVMRSSNPVFVPKIQDVRIVASY